MNRYKDRQQSDTFPLIPHCHLARQPWGGILKRIEGRHGASVVAVFNFLRDMIQLNLLLLLLLIGGVVIPSSYFVSDDGGSQGFSWSLNDTRNLCVGIQLDFDNQVIDFELRCWKWTLLLKVCLVGICEKYMLILHLE